MPMKQDSTLPPGHKRCSTCREPKPFADFGRDRSMKTGLKSRCKACQQAYREANRDTLKAKHRQYYEANRDRLFQQQRAYRVANGAKIKDYQRRYQKENRDRLRQQKLLYRQSNREAVRRRNRRYQAAHAEELSDYQSQYRIEYAEKLKAYRRQHYLNNRETIQAYQQRRRQHFTEMARIRRRARLARDPRYRDMIRANESRRRAQKAGAFVEHVSFEVLYQRDRGICSICHQRCPKAQASIDHIVPLSKGGAHSYANCALACLTCNFSKNNRTVPQQTRLF